MKRAIGVVLQVTLLVGLTTAVIGTAPASAVTLDPNCTANTLPGNDDGSTSSIPLAFTLNFFGTPYDHLFVNNNGNVTFDAPNGNYTPGPIDTSNIPVIAPFWADIDTRPGSPDSDVTYGTTNFDGDPAFCATWPGVGRYSTHTDTLNYFQVLLVDRSTGNTAGDFDIVFNYQNIQWDASDSPGGARAGYTNGTAATSYELPGSGTPGSFVDTNMSTGLVNNTNNGTDGRYLYQVRNGAPPHQLAVSKDGTGTGTVTSSPAGIDCGGTCSASFADSTPVDLTATADPGSVFTGWTGDCSGTGTCSLTMSADHAVNATFDTAPPVTHELTVSKGDGTGSGTVTSDPTGIDCGESCQASFDEGTPVDLTATADPGSVFTGWHGSGCSGTGGCTVTMDADHTVTAIFDTAEGSPALTLTKSDSPDPVDEQNPITYTLDVGNAGSGDATGVVLTDDLPAGTTFNQVSTTQGSCSNTATTVTCNLGTVGVEGTATVTLIVQAPDVTANTVITNNASVSADNSDTASASADTTVLVNSGGSTSGDVPPDSQAPMSFTTSTSSSNGQPAVTSTDKTAVSIIVPPGGPGGSVSLDELPCPTAPCTGAAAAKDRAAQAAATGQLVLGGVVYNVIPPSGYPNNKPFKVTMLYDKTLHPKAGAVFYFKQGVTPHEIKLPKCGTGLGKPCVLTNALITTGPPAVKGDWKVVVRINSDPRMHR